MPHETVAVRVRMCAYVEASFGRGVHQDGGHVVPSQLSHARVHTRITVFSLSLKTLSSSTAIHLPFTQLTVLRS